VGGDLCNSCFAEIEQMEKEYAAYLANAPLLQKAVWKVEGTVNRTKNAISFWSFQRQQRCNTRSRR
jgi:hypothetical protein